MAATAQRWAITSSGQLIPLTIKGKNTNHRSSENMVKKPKKVATMTS